MVNHRKLNTALSLALLANTSCDTLNLFPRNCAPENVQDTWVSEGSPRTIALTLRNFKGAITQEALESAVVPYDSSQNPAGDDYSLRVLNQSGEVVFYRNFSFAAGAGSDSLKGKPKTWGNPRATLYIPARVDMSRAEVYNSNCQKVFEADIEAAALENSS
jgi:hypothetical protein